MLSAFLAAFLATTTLAVPSKKEGAADLIEKAHNLGLQKDRIQAVNVLVAAIRREPNNSPTARELKGALQDIGSVFFGDKAQQLYELSLSLRRTDLAQAQARIAEALRIEPDNLQLVNESARLQILKGDCATASEALAKTRKWNPYDEQTLLTSAQAATCQSDWPSYVAFRSQADGKKGALSQAWLALEVERALKEKSESRAKESMETLRKLDANHPEFNYWNWKLETSAAKRKAFARTYVSNCRSLTSVQVRLYAAEPLLCQHQDDVKADLNVAGDE